MNRAKSKSVNKGNCINCLEERKKADQSRKYAHELKNIFITISTVVDSEIESPQPFTFSQISNTTSHIDNSGDVSPFIMEGRRARGAPKSNINTNSNNNINNKDSPFYFLKTLCDYGKTLIKELNDMGKDYINDGAEIEPFNISKAIDFCVDMFDTKRKYDKTNKNNLQIYSDINFSCDKVNKSISETGFKMVLINLLTNSYKFTTKGKIIVRAVSIPKEKKIRIMVKDTGRGFNPNEFKKNGCFYVYEKNQELNADGSGLGLSIVSGILTKFNIKLDCISNAQKGGTLFFFDLDDIFPYYDEINPKNLMTESLRQIIKDINMGKRDNEFIMSPKKSFKENIMNMTKNLNENNNRKKLVNEEDSQKEKQKEINNFNSNNDINIVNNQINNNNLKINFNNNDKHRFSFTMTGDINSSPIFNESNKNNNNKLPNSKNLNVNIYNLNNATLFSFDKESDKKRKNSDKKNDSNNNNIMMSTSNKKISGLNLRKNSKENNKLRKESKSNNMLKHVIEDSNNFHKLKTFNSAAKKVKEIQIFKQRNKVKTNNEDTERNENEIDALKELNKEINKFKKIKDEKNKNKKNYKKLLDKNFNKTNFYLSNLKKIFQKNEIYIQLSCLKKKKCITEPSSEKNSAKKLKKKKTFYNDPKKVYIIICDDEEFVARSARELIINYYAKKGKEPHVYYTPNGIECLYLMYKLSIIENRQIEYILLDLEMPYLSGIKTCNIIKSIKDSNPPRVFILSGDEPSDCEADGYCNKPLNEIDIINKLDIENKNL